MSHAWIDGRPVPLHAATAEAARLLAASRVPVVAGMGFVMIGILYVGAPLPVRAICSHAWDWPGG